MRLQDDMGDDCASRRALVIWLMKRIVATILAIAGAWAARRLGLDGLPEAVAAAVWVPVEVGMAFVG